MKQSDYAIHRPIVEGKSGSGKVLDAEIQRIVDSLPANPTFEQIEAGYSQAQKFEQSKSSWGKSPAGAASFSDNYYGRIARKLGVKAFFYAGQNAITKFFGSKAPAVAYSNLKGTGAGIDLDDSDKASAERLNDLGVLHPEAADYYEIELNRSAPQPEPELEPQEKKPKEELPPAEVPVVQRPVNQNSTTVSAKTNTEPVAAKAEDDGCPQFFMARSGLKFKIYLSEPGKEAGDPYFDKELSFDEARKAVSELNANIDCTIPSEEAVSNAVNAAALPAILAAGLVGRKRVNGATPEKKPPERLRADPPEKPLKNRPPEELDSKRKKKMIHGEDPWSEKRVATGRSDGKNPKPDPKPDPNRRPMSRQNTFDYDPKAEQDWRRRNRLNQRRRNLSRTSNPDEIGRRNADWETRRKQNLRVDANRGRTRASNPDEAGRRAADFETRRKQNLRVDANRGRTRASNPDEAGRRAADFETRRKQNLRTNTRMGRNRASSPEEIARRADDINTRKLNRLSKLTSPSSVAGSHQRLGGKRYAGYDSNYNKWDNARKDQFRQRPEASKKTDISKSRLGSADDLARRNAAAYDGSNPDTELANRYRTNDVGPKYRRTPDRLKAGVGSSASPNHADELAGQLDPEELRRQNAARKAQQFLKNPKPNNPLSKYNDVTPSGSSIKEPIVRPTPHGPQQPLRNDQIKKTGGKETIKTSSNDGYGERKPIWQTGIDDASRERAIAKSQQFLKNPNENPLSKYDDVTPSKNTPIEFDKEGPGKSGVARQGSGDVDDTLRTKTTDPSKRPVPVNLDDPGALRGEKPVKPALPKEPIITPASTKSKKAEMPTAQQLRLGNQIPAPAQSVSGGGITPATHRPIKIDINSNTPVKVLQALDPNKMPELPKIEHNAQHKLLLGILDGADNPPDGNLEKYLNDMRASMKNINPKLLDDITDLTKLYVSKINVGGLPEASKTNLKQVTAGLISNNSTYTNGGFMDELKNFEINVDTRLPRPNAKLEPISKESKPLTSGEIDLERYRNSATVLSGDDLASWIQQNGVTRNNIPFELVDPKVTKTEELLNIFQAKDSTLNKSLTSDAGQEALERLTHGQIKPQEFAQSIEVTWKDKNAPKFVANAMQGSTIDLDKLEKAMGQANISKTLAAHTPNNRPVDGSTFGSSLETNLSAAENAAIARKQEQLLAMQKHEREMRRLMQNAEGESMRAYTAYEKAMAAEQAARKKYIEDAQKLGAEGREEAARARRTAAYEREIAQLQADTNKAATAYWNSVKNSPNSEQLQQSVEREMRDAKTFPETGTAPAGDKSAELTKQANTEFDNIQQRKLAEPDPSPNFDPKSQLTVEPEPSTPAAEIQAQADKIAAMNGQSPPSSTQTKYTVGDKKMVNGAEYEWLGAQWRNNTTGKMATSTVAQQLNSPTTPLKTATIPQKADAQMQQALSDLGVANSEQPGTINQRNITPKDGELQKPTSSSMAGPETNTMAGTTQDAINKAGPGKLIPVSEENKNTWGEFKEERKAIDERTSGGNFEERKKNLTDADRAQADRLGVKDAKELDELEGGRDEQKKLDTAINKGTAKIEAQRKEIEAGANSESLEKQHKANVSKSLPSSREIAERLAKMPKSVATSIAKKLGIAIVATSAAIGAVPGAAFGLAIWALDLLDVYDIVVLMVAAGWIDDTNEELMALREKDLEKIDAYLRNDDTSDDDKRAYVARMLQYDSVSAFNPKWWFGGLEQWKNDITGGRVFNNKWAKENFMGETYGGGGFAVTVSKPNAETGKDEPVEMPLTPFNIHKLSVVRDVPKQPRTSGDMREFRKRVESIARRWKQGPYYFINIDKNGGLQVLSKTFKDIRNEPNNQVFAEGHPIIIGSNETTAPAGRYDARNAPTVDLSQGALGFGMVDPNKMTDAKYALQEVLDNYDGYFLTDNYNQIIQNIKNPNDRRYVDDIFNGRASGVVGIKVEMARFLATEAEKQYERVKAINPLAYKDERADAHEEFILRRLSSGHYKEETTESHKIILYRKMKKLTERLNTYRNAKYFITGR